MKTKIGMLLIAMCMSAEKFYTGTNSTETYGYNENPVTIKR